MLPQAGEGKVIWIIEGGLEGSKHSASKKLFSICPGDKVQHRSLITGAMDI